jgi:hypothetical protein
MPGLSYPIHILSRKGQNPSGSWLNPPRTSRQDPRPRTGHACHDCCRSMPVLQLAFIDLIDIAYPVRVHNSLNILLQNTYQPQLPLRFTFPLQEADGVRLSIARIQVCLFRPAVPERCPAQFAFHIVPERTGAAIRAGPPQTLFCQPLLNPDLAHPTQVS